MATLPHPAPRHHQVSEAEAMAMAMAALETARRSLHPGFFHLVGLIFARHKFSRSGRQQAPRSRWYHWPGWLVRAMFGLPEVLVIGAAMLVCTAGALHHGFGP